MLWIIIAQAVVNGILGGILIYSALRDKTDPVDVHVDASITMNSDTRGLL